jgi:hypothetical protein
MTLNELQQALRRVIGIELPMSEPRWMTRATDTSRQAERYREGHVLLAGDAAHVPFAYGGMGPAETSLPATVNKRARPGLTPLRSMMCSVLLPLTNILFTCVGIGLFPRHYDTPLVQADPLYKSQPFREY